MSRQIEVYGVNKVSQNYLEKFFKKAGTIAKITFKQDRVLIKYNREEAAIRAVELNGKILEDYQIKVRLRQVSPSKLMNKSLQLNHNATGQYEQFSLFHLKLAQDLIWSSDMPEHRQIIMSILFRIKVSEIVFYQRTKQNSEYNLFASFLQYQFLKPQSRVKINKMRQGRVVYFMNTKGKMITKDSQKIVTEKIKRRKQFQTKLKHYSKRIFELYTVIFERESLIKSVDEEFDIEQEFQVQPFQGFIFKNISTILLEGYQQYIRDNIMMLKQRQNYWKCYRFDGILYFLTDTNLISRSYVALYEPINNSLQKVQTISVNGLCLVIEMKESLYQFEKLKSKVSDIESYKKVIFSDSNKQTHVLILFDQQLPSQEILQPLIQKYRQQISYPLHFITISSTQQMQKSVYMHFLQCNIQKSKDHYNTRKAEDLAEELIKLGHDQLFGRTSSFQISKDILAIQRQLPKFKKTK